MGTTNILDLNNRVSDLEKAVSGLTATDVAYDNTDSGLTATDVQGAVDELKSAVNNLIVAEDRALNFVNGACNVEIPTGYILVAAIGVATDNFIFGYTLTTGTTGYRLALSNNTSVSLTIRLVYASQYATLNA